MENIARISSLLSELNLDWAVLSGVDSVCFATGHQVPIEIGANPFSGGPTLAIVGRDGSCGVVCSNTDGVQIAGVNYELYAGFANAVTNQIGNYHSATERMIKSLGVSGKIGIERNSFPFLLADILRPDSVNLDVPLARLKAIKTSTELVKLRLAAQVAATGQEEARRVSKAGVAELAAFGFIRASMERMAGNRCALTGEYVTGIERTSTLGSPPVERIMVEGDPVLCDLAPRVDGYWGDSCSAFVIGGQPTAAYRKLFNAAKETLELAIAELRPGLRVCDFDAKLRANMLGHGYTYPHHSGHGIGTSVHEYPRLVADETALFEKNMVIMVEPGSYIPNIGGARCEYMLRVTSTGSEIMAKFELSCG
ncbi:MAG: aminopeptidase P family protein [Rhizobiales bacterium]|nr:Xaa-Pro peptidase family protein [Hyphomicrobiales bacterium]NRB15431.1 aminopeptidase P family protein [Hyphomicrobiales bacterium]